MPATELCNPTEAAVVGAIDGAGDLCPHCGTAAAHAEPVTKAPTARPLLLVVDDEQPVLRVVERLAAKAGFDVVTCGSGRDAMRALMRKPADLAMLDLRMPDVNGLDLLRQIRTSVPSCEVILMTAHAAVDSAVEAIKLGAREYLATRSMRRIPTSAFCESRFRQRSWWRESRKCWRGPLGPPPRFDEKRADRVRIWRTTTNPGRSDPCPPHHRLHRFWHSSKSTPFAHNRRCAVRSRC